MCQQFWLIQFEYPHGCVDQVADTTSGRLHAAGPQLKVGCPIVTSDPIFVMHFFKGFQRSAKPFRHHLGMLSDIAVLVGVRMGWFEDKNVPRASMIRPRPLPRRGVTGVASAVTVSQ